MKKKTGILLTLAALLVLGAVLSAVFSGPQPGGTYENLVRNGDFEAGSDGWVQDAYVTTTGYTVFETRPGEGVDGSGALYIRNDYPNDARFVQEVEVSPSTLYHLHGYIKASAQQGLGANLSVDGVYTFSDLAYDTAGEWQEVSLYGMTGEKQTTLNIFVRLGGYSGESVGEAWFDNVTLNRVDAVPSGYAQQNLFVQEVADSTAGDGTQDAANLPLIAAALAYLMLCYGCMQTMRRQDGLQTQRGGTKWVLAIVCAVALVLRIVLALWVRGYDVDTNDFMVWASQMVERAPWGFYVAGGFCDYPPGYMLILWALGAIGKLCGGMSILLVKLPSILCDILTVVFIYRMAIKLGKTDKTALALAVLYAFNPLTLTAGAAWGQVDSVMALMLCAVIYFALNGQWRWALPMYVIAVLTKPQALMFGPLGLIALVMEFVNIYREKDKERVRALWLQFGQGMACLVLAAAVIVVPFSVYQGGIGWVFDLYGRTMSYYSQATVNSCNLYFLFGLNWVDVNGYASLGIALCGTLVLVLPCVIFAFVKKQPVWLKITACAASVLLLGTLLVLQGMGILTYARMGTVLMALSIALVLAVYVRTGDKKHLPLLGAVLLTVLFTLGTMMHERYLFPALIFLLLAYLLEKDKRILWLMAGITVLCLFNVGAVLDRNMRIGGAAGHLSAPAFGIQSDLGVLEYISAVGSLLASMAAVYLGLDLCRKDAKGMELTPVQPAAVHCGEENADPAGYRVSKLLPGSRMDKKDYLIMGTVTVLFAVLTFTNLGSAKAPQQDYVFTSPEEQVVFDLGENQTFNLLYYGGIHWSNSNFTFEVSDDGEIWEGPYTAQISDSGDCFKWKYVVTTYGTETVNFTSTPVLFDARYVRLTADHVGLTLFEVLARDENGNVLPMAIADGAAGTERLIDEQDTLEGEPGWYNSTYFDEIYHARTAYEHLHGLRTYEWTHPPLGKVMMSWAISIFGMTPFGWRFAGALMGVMMLPGMYLMGKMLFKRRLGAIAPMELMALDFMHFTQTRIATIDSFVVCFIIWAVYFMLRYMALDYWNIKPWKTFVPLALSGLFMGLSIASKWTGCYAGVGLALLFFWSVWRRCQYVRLVRRTPARQRTQEEKLVADMGYRRIGLNVLSCFIFFVAVPLMVYAASYIPFCAYTGGVTVKKIIEECERMLTYHATPGLGMDHYFYSPWYEWPLAVTPMWYSSSAYETPGMQSTIMAFGNPAVWWVGAVALIAMMGVWCVRHVRRDGTIGLHARRLDARPAVLLICFFAQYLPWMLVPRGTYIYHYFTAVPFVILATVYMGDWLEDRKKGLGKWLFIGQAALALVLFVAFFPYISGVTVPEGWLDGMNWFPGWLWY